MATGTDFMKVDIKMAIKAAGRFDSTMPGGGGDLELYSFRRNGAATTTTFA